jgi:hypothetical protein
MGYGAPSAATTTGTSTPAQQATLRTERVQNESKPKNISRRATAAARQGTLMHAGDSQCDGALYKNAPLQSYDTKPRQQWAHNHTHV